jgi:hypothetical protein
MIWLVYMLRRQARPLYALRLELTPSFSRCSNAVWRTPYETSPRLSPTYMLFWFQMLLIESIQKRHPVRIEHDKLMLLAQHQQQGLVGESKLCDKIVESYLDHPVLLVISEAG